MPDFRPRVDVNYETEVGGALLMASGFFFYVTLEPDIVGAVLVTVGAWAMVLPRVVRSGTSTSW
ncbi:hypothetical protein SAMN05216559_3968 [Halomicrobium zhouii]|uniref:Uncharacterized protein n=1 Tax=Halomicrobium zhouii TaxID=767519 RepID=A0A1I6M824_9EURY|nr:hypothetical protein SAMN05216559_3968 [Halomicrobium zhouii]